MQDKETQPDYYKFIAPSTTINLALMLLAWLFEGYFAKGKFSYIALITSSFCMILFLTTSIYLIHKSASNHIHKILLDYLGPLNIAYAALLLSILLWCFSVKKPISSTLIFVLLFTPNWLVQFFQEKKKATEKWGNDFLNIDLKQAKNKRRTSPREIKYAIRQITSLHTSINVAFLPAWAKHVSYLLLFLITMSVLLICISIFLRTTWTATILQITPLLIFSTALIASYLSALVVAHARHKINLIKKLNKHLQNRANSN